MILVRLIGTQLVIEFKGQIFTKLGISKVLIIKPIAVVDDFIWR